jgi:hypothetical protein
MVTDPAHPRVSRQVFDLVEIEGTRDQSLQGAGARTGNESGHPLTSRVDPGLLQYIGHVRVCEMANSERLMRGEARLFE